MPIFKVHWTTVVHIDEKNIWHETVCQTESKEMASELIKETYQQLNDIYIEEVEEIFDRIIYTKEM